MAAGSGPPDRTCAVHHRRTEPNMSRMSVLSQQSKQRHDERWRGQGPGPTDPATAMVYMLRCRTAAGLARSASEVRVLASSTVHTKV
jgi:hypothetical protein